MGFFARQTPGFQPRNTLTVSIDSLRLLSASHQELNILWKMKKKKKKMDPNVGLGCSNKCPPWDTGMPKGRRNQHQDAACSNFYHQLFSCSDDDEKNCVFHSINASCSIFKALFLFSTGKNSSPWSSMNPKRKLLQDTWLQTYLVKSYESHSNRNQAVTSAVLDVSAAK